MRAKPDTVISGDPDTWCHSLIDTEDGPERCMKPSGHDGQHWAILSSLTWTDADEIQYP